MLGYNSVKSAAPGCMEVIPLGKTQVCMEYYKFLKVSWTKSIEKENQPHTKANQTHLTCLSKFVQEKKAILNPSSPSVLAWEGKQAWKQPQYQFPTV